MESGLRGEFQKKHKNTEPMDGLAAQELAR